MLEKRKDKETEATTRSYIGRIYAELGEPRKAIGEYSLALQLVRDLDNRVRAANILFALGSLYEEVGEKQKASDYFRQALSAYKVLGDQKNEAETLHRINRLQ